MPVQANGIGPDHRHVTIFTANRDDASILGFSVKSKGNAAPTVRIAGSKTVRPFALSFDGTGRLLVADEDVGVLVFAKGANGNVASVATITGLNHADGVVADASNHIWVAEFLANSVKEFADNANGNATPLRTIQGSKTTLNGANYLALH